MLENWERGFILYKKSHGETSLLLEVFTENHGKVSLLAKGARNKNNKLKGILQLFTPLLLKWVGKGQLKTLTHAEVLSLTMPLYGESLYSGFYLNELLERLLEHDTEYSSLFLLYIQSLSNIAQNIDNIEKVLRTFELTLLSEIGFAVNFRLDIHGVEIQDDVFYEYLQHEGFKPSINIDNTSFQGKQLLLLANLDFSDQNTLRVAKRFIRMIFQYFFKTKPLKSRELFMSLKKN